MNKVMKKLVPFILVLALTVSCGAFGMAEEAAWFSNFQFEDPRFRPPAETDLPELKIRSSHRPYGFVLIKSPSNRRNIAHFL